MSKKFEYKTIVIEADGFWTPKFDFDEVDKTLSEFGKDGWELVSVQDRNYGGTSYSFHYTFKREI